MYQINVLYTLNSHNVICWLYHNKAVGGRVVGKKVSSQKKKSWKEKKKKRMKYLELQTMKMNTSTYDPHKICNYDITIFIKDLIIYENNTHEQENYSQVCNLNRWIKMLSFLFISLTKRKLITNTNNENEKENYSAQTYNLEIPDVILTLPLEDEENYIHEIGKFHGWGRVNLLSFIRWRPWKMAITSFWHHINILSKTEFNPN